MADPHAILVVDDDESMLDYCVAILSSYGFAVASASTGRQAVARLEAERFSIVLTDHVTVGADATPILRVVKSLQPGAEVILMSAIPTLKEAAASYLAGATAYLPKPFTEADFASALLRCLQKPAGRSPPEPRPEPASAWFRELFVQFEDGSRQRLPIERKATGTHDPRLAPMPAPWTRLGFHQCPGCPLQGPETACPAAVSMQATLDRLRDHRSFERVTATAVDGAGRSQTVEWPLQEVGSTLVQLAVFASGCPVGRECKPYLEGLPPFADAQALARKILASILRKHGGDWRGARAELQGVLARLHEVFVHLLERLREGGASPTQDAVPNSIVHLDTFVQMLGFRADSLFKAMTGKQSGAYQDAPAALEKRRE
ncbi:MAG: response regulator [Elusimicrobia bacterium]|nr:response regulator [Elusimicrobiota bacterium]